MCALSLSFLLTTRSRFSEISTGFRAPPKQPETAPLPFPYQAPRNCPKRLGKSLRSTSPRQFRHNELAWSSLTCTSRYPEQHSTKVCVLVVW